MIRNMTAILYNIAYNCIGTLFLGETSLPKITKYGMMDVLGNSKVEFLGTSSVDIQRLLMAATAFGLFLDLVTGKDPMMAQVLS